MRDYIEPRDPTALLYTCHQIRSEAQGLLMSTSTFDLRICGALRFVKDFGKDKTALVTSIICEALDVPILRHGVENRRGCESLRYDYFAGFHKLSPATQCLTPNELEAVSEEGPLGSIKFYLI